MRYQEIATPEKRADWPRKVALPYSRLTESEKASDRMEVSKTLNRIRQFIDAALREHQHTDACWEPDSGCDMGRNEKFVRVALKDKP